MKAVKGIVCVLLVLSATAWSMPLGSSARTVIPSDIQQIISVDYRALKNSDTAMALKQQVLPPSLKEFEGALRGVGIDPDKDVEQLTFASYRSGKQGVRVVGIAQGQFAMAACAQENAAAESEADQAAQLGYLSHASRHADDLPG